MTQRIAQAARIVNQKGLHARASRKLAETALRFRAAMWVRREDETVDATSLMDLMMLGAGIGCEVEILAEGEDAHEAVAAVAQLIANKFGEED